MPTLRPGYIVYMYSVYTRCPSVSQCAAALDGQMAVVLPLRLDCSLRRFVTVSRTAARSSADKVPVGRRFFGGWLNVHRQQNTAELRARPHSPLYTITTG